MSDKRFFHSQLTLKRAIIVPLFALLLCACFLGACTVGPDYVAPDISLPTTWQQTSQARHSPDNIILARYWESLSDKYLNHLIEEGLQSNLSLQEALLRIEEAAERYRIERGGYYPDIDLAATLLRRRRSESVASAISAPNNDIVSLGGALNWEIDLLGRVRRLNESSKATLEASIEEYQGVLVTFVAELASAYIRFRSLQMSINLAIQNITLQQNSLSLAQDRFQAGVAPELDVRQAESNLGQTQAALPLLRIALAQELHAIAVLTGKYPEEIKEDLLREQQMPSVPNLRREVLPFDIIQQRPDLRQTERMLAAQHALIGASEAELYPIISLPGVFSFEALNTLENAFLRKSLAYSIGPSIQLNLLDFGRVRGNIGVQEKRTQQLLKRYEQQTLTAVQQVEDAIIALFEQKKRTEFLSGSVSASRKSAELVKSLYISGLTDFQNVLDSERRLFEQEISLVNSKESALSAYIALFRSLGGGWQQQPSPPLTATILLAARLPS